VNADESDDAFLQKLISRIPPWTGKWLTTSKGTFRVGNEEEARLLDIAQRRGKMAASMLEEILKHSDNLLD
jgi:hypothetical protein